MIMIIGWLAIFSRGSFKAFCKNYTMGSRRGSNKGDRRV